MGRLSHVLARASAIVFLPLRVVFGRFHRRRRVVGDRLEEHKGHAPLPEPWSGDDRWFRAGFPPRAHNRIVPLPHGGEYFPDLCESLASARTRVTICGWCMTPLMSLLRNGETSAPGSVLAEVLREVSERAEVYVLLWSGAPALFDPDTETVKRVRQTLRRIAPKVRCELDFRAAFSHDHHQKAVTVDGKIAYVGGMDLTTFQGDRWDTAQHLLRFGPNWHDVQLRIEGEAVQDVEDNFCQRWNAVTGETLEPLRLPADPSLSQPAQVVRTVPRGFYPFADDGEFGIAHAYLHAIERAERFIYLENQYLWCPEIVEALMEAMNRRRTGPFRIVLVLPASAYTGKYDNDAHVRKLSDADEGRGIFHAYSPYASGPASGVTGYRYLPIYVHAKVGIIDDEWLTVGSANLNNRGLATDTEMNVQSVAPDLARRLRVSLWSDHLQMDPAEIESGDPITLLDTAWKERSRRLEEALHAAGPPPPGHAIRYRPGTNPGSRALDLLQSWTLEH